MEVQNVSGSGWDAASAARASGLRERSVGRVADSTAVSNEPAVDTGNVQASQTTPPVESVVKTSSTHLYVDAASKRIVAQIMDENNELIKQIPPEEVLKIAARFAEVNGKLFDKNV